jgi:leucyl-tRNA synthetase
MAEELWQTILGGQGSAHAQTWPAFDASAAAADAVELAVQVNGKVRGRVVVPVDLPNESIIALALTEVGSWVEGKDVKKVVVVPGKLVSVVVAG